jgi:hypothetical protein
VAITRLTVPCSGTSAFDPADRSGGIREPCSCLQREQSPIIEQDVDYDARVARKFWERIMRRADGWLLSFAHVTHPREIC